MATSTSIAIRARPELPALQIAAPEFLRQYAPVRVVEIYSGVSTAVQAVDSTIPTLLDIEKAYGREYVLGYLKLWILEISDYLGSTQPTDQQLTLTAGILYDKNKVLNLADLKLIVESILSGEVTITGTLTGVKLCPIFRKYWERRQIDAQDYNDARGKVILKATLDVNVVLEGYAKDLEERTKVRTLEELRADEEREKRRQLAKAADARIKLMIKQRKQNGTEKNM